MTEGIAGRSEGIAEGNKKKERNSRIRATKNKGQRPKERGTKETPKKKERDAEEGPCSRVV